MQPSARHRLLNRLHSALLIIGMGLIVWLTVSALAGAGAALVLLGAALLGLALAPKVPRRALMACYGARRLDDRTFPQGAAWLRELGRRAELPHPPVLYYIPSAVPNAFALGEPDDSVVCVSDALLRLLDRREFLGVLAHEVSHIAHRDLWIMGLADSLTRVTTLISYLGQFLLVISLPLILTGNALFPWTLPLLLIFAPTLLSLLQLALSRTREFEADRGAVQLTGDAGGLASALLKLERRRGAYWEEILLPGRRIPEPSLLRTHPPTAERVARLKDLQPRPLPRIADAEPPTVRVPTSLDVVHRPPRLRWNGVWY